MSKGISIAGRKKNDGIDFYQTPRYAIEKLLCVENFEGIILEPCSGAGAISKVLEENKYKVISSDIRTDQNVYGEKGVDILNINEKVDNIITNPPYIIAKEVIQKSLELTNKKVVMLLKLAFLESAGRYTFFQETPLKKVYVFSKRITMYPEGEEKPENGGTIAFAWYVWEHGYKGIPQIHWIL